MSDFFVVPATGWINDPVEVSRVMQIIHFRQGISPYYSHQEPSFEQTADDATILFWKAEEKVLGSVLKSWNQGNVGSCFPAGTKIRMADGSYKKIEEMRLNDVVLTAEGNTGKVSHLFVRHENECLIQMKCHGHYGIQATSEHPILTKNGYVKIGDLKIGDLVAIPKYLPETTKYIQTNNHRTWVSRLYRENDSSGRMITYNGTNNFNRKAAVIQKTVVPDIIELTPKFGRILGLFLAEGGTDKNKLVWTFARKEETTLVAELLELLQEVLGAIGHLQFRGNTCKVSVYGRVWCELFESLCGNGSGKKALHFDITSGPKDFLQSLYEAWLDGDGHEKINSIQGTTISHELALNMYDIANYLGLNPVIRHCDPKPSHGVKSRQRRYDVVTATGDGHKPLSDEKTMWRKITSLIAIPYQGDVFNFEVEGDNSYVAEGIGVHNCVSFGWGRACQDLLLGEIAAGDMEEYPNAQVATEPIYGGSRVEVGGGRIGGDGSVGAWAAEWVRRWGILFRLKYGEVDLTSYNEKRCREYGRYGCPDELEPVAKEHPVQTVAMVRSGPEAWSAIGNWYPIPVCSDRGFTTTLREGFCEPSGNWNHCMTIRGKFVHPTKGKSFVIQNSWGGYLNGEKMIKDVHGVEHELPEGCFATTMNVVDAMMRQEDSFAISNFKGFPSRKLSWYI